MDLVANECKRLGVNNQLTILFNMLSTRQFRPKYPDGGSYIRDKPQDLVGYEFNNQRLFGKYWTVKFIERLNALSSDVYKKFKMKSLPTPLLRDYHVVKGRRGGRHRLNAIAQQVYIPFEDVGGAESSAAAAASTATSSSSERAPLRRISNRYDNPAIVVPPLGPVDRSLIPGRAESHTGTDFSGNGTVRAPFFRYPDEYNVRKRSGHILLAKQVLGPHVFSDTSLNRSLISDYRRAALKVLDALQYETRYRKGLAHGLTKDDHLEIILGLKNFTKLNTKDLAQIPDIDIEYYQVVQSFDRQVARPDRMALSLEHWAYHKATGQHLHPNYPTRLESTGGVALAPNLADDKTDVFYAGLVNSWADVYHVYDQYTWNVAGPLAGKDEEDIKIFMNKHMLVRLGLGADPEVYPPELFRVSLLPTPHPEVDVLGQEVPIETREKFDSVLTLKEALRPDGLKPYTLGINNGTFNPAGPVLGHGFHVFRYAEQNIDRAPRLRLESTPAYPIPNDRDVTVSRQSTLKPIDLLDFRALEDFYGPDVFPVRGGQESSINKRIEEADPSTSVFAGLHTHPEMLPHPITYRGSARKVGRPIALRFETIAVFRPGTFKARRRYEGREDTVGEFQISRPTAVFTEHLFLFDPPGDVSKGIVRGDYDPFASIARGANLPSKR